MSRTPDIPKHRPLRFLFQAAVISAMGLLSLPAGTAAQSRATTGCEICHGELEFLRAQSGSLGEARRILVTGAEVHGSAHTGMDCGECHSGFARWPHAETAASRSCVSCHAAQDSLWRHSVHADTTTSEPADCVSCHSIHSVMTAAEMAEEAGAGRANARCAECHESARLGPGSPHAHAVLCTTCHSAHETKRVDDPSAGVAAANQYATCRTCHEEDTEEWPADAHGRALLEGASHAGAEGGHAPPSCTECHGGHDMVALEDAAFDERIVERCTACHEDEAERYLETYHGQASALGSEIVATCSACHGSHDILPSEEPASTVAEANLVGTCGECHPQARASFVAYDSHPDPHDRERSGAVYYAFLFMNLLLVGVFGFFGLHTVLWWSRLLAGRKGEGQGNGGHHA